MKGVIFTLFQDMVEDQFGLDVWEQLIEKSKVASGGVYTSGKTYSDDEIVALITELSAFSGQSAAVLIEHFGQYLPPNLLSSLPLTVNQYTDLWSFLAAIDSVIHIEVKKISPDALTPEIRVVAHDEGMMDLSYKSPRKLCFLAIGLIKQAGVHFNTEVSISHGQCMHDGHDHCVLRVESLEKTYA